MAFDNRPGVRSLAIPTAIRRIEIRMSIDTNRWGFMASVRCGGSSVCDAALTGVDGWQCEEFDQEDGKAKLRKNKATFVGYPGGDYSPIDDDAKWIWSKVFPEAYERHSVVCAYDFKG